ncbi:hypothetical protein KAW08_00355 [bacterium]|nr:hypothetical protein [bacterium]
METKKTNNIFRLILFGILAVGFTGHCFAVEKNLEAFEKARQDALLSRCKSNIKQLLACIKMYAQDYDGRYPDKLSDLSIYLKRLDTFTCRASKDKITSKKEIDTKSSYEYRGAGLTKEIGEKDPDKIILIEKNYNHTIDGKLVRCVGYAGGYVGMEQQKMETKVYSPNYRSAQEIEESLKKALKPDERRKIVCDKKRNYLIITDSVSNHKKIKEAITKLDQPKPQFRIKITSVKTKENGEPVRNSQEVVALLDTPASINIGDKDFPPYCHYEVTPSLTKEGMILLKMDYEMAVNKGKITGGKRQYILKDGETKELSGPPGSKRKTIIFIEKIKAKKSTTVTDENIIYLKDKNEIASPSARNDKRNISK